MTQENYQQRLFLSRSLAKIFGSLLSVLRLSPPLEMLSPYYTEIVTSFLGPKKEKKTKEIEITHEKECIRDMISSGRKKDNLEFIK